MLEQYKAEEYIRVQKLFTSERRIFGSKVLLAKWFLQQLERQNYCCYYCETSIFVIKKLIAKGLLKTRKTGNGIRGPILEIDKNDDLYIPGNCVLSCYYCNNDKSYISAKDDYKKFFGENRKRYFEELEMQTTDDDTPHAPVS